MEIRKVLLKTTLNNELLMFMLRIFAKLRRGAYVSIPGKLETVPVARLLCKPATMQHWMPLTDRPQYLGCYDPVIYVSFLERANMPNTPFALYHRTLRTRVKHAVSGMPIPPKPYHRHKTSWQDLYT